MIEPGIAFANLADNATLAEALLKHLRTVLAERADDVAFFQERIEMGGALAR